MTGIDWAIVVLAVLFVPVGWREGLVVGSLTLAGFAGGAVLGARLGPLLLSGGAESPYAPRSRLRRACSSAESSPRFSRASEPASGSGSSAARASVRSTAPAGPSSSPRWRS